MTCFNRNTKYFKSGQVNSGQVKLKTNIIMYNLKEKKIK